MFSFNCSSQRVWHYIGEHPKNYSCPIYCEAEHKHINMEKYEIEYKKFEQIDSMIVVQSLEGEIASQNINKKEKDK